MKLVQSSLLSCAMDFNPQRLVVPKSHMFHIILRLFEYIYYSSNLVNSEFVFQNVSLLLKFSRILGQIVGFNLLT